MEDDKNILSLISTPAYIFDYDLFSDRSYEIKKLLGEEIKLCYSMKANPFFVDDLPTCFNKIEVCSHGEFKICQKTEIEPVKIFYSGVNKRDYEIEEAINYGVRNFTIESYKHLEDLAKLSKKHKVVLNVYPRIAADTQFGLDEKDVKAIISDYKNDQYLFIKGIHYFTGTQKKKSAIIIEELEYLYDFIKNVEKDIAFKIQEVEYGTGLYIEYFGARDNDYIELLEIKEELLKLRNLTSLTIEMGRFFAATAGNYFTRIDDVKRNFDTNYLLIDGGINQLVYDGQLKAMRKPLVKHYKMLSSEKDQLKDEWTICGSLCTPNDVIVKDLELSNPQIGDVLRFDNVGAYSFMEGMSVFLSREMPQIWGIKRGKLILLRDYIDTYEFNS